MTHKLHTRKQPRSLPEDGLELRPKHVAAVTNNDSVHQVGIKYGISSSVFGATHPAAQDHIPVRPESSETMLREPQTSQCHTLIHFCATHQTVHWVLCGTQHPVHTQQMTCIATTQQHFNNFNNVF